MINNETMYAKEKIFKGSKSIAFSLSQSEEQQQLLSEHRIN